MSPVQVDMAISIMQLLATSIQKRLKDHNELLALFNEANEEGRDFTEEEVKLWRAKADVAMKELEDLVISMDE